MKSSLASATSVIALLALESGHAVAPAISLASSTAAILTAMAVDSAPADASAITFSGTGVTGGPTTSATLTIIDLVDGSGTSGSATLLAKNANTSATRTITGSAFSTNGLSGSAFSLAIGRNATASAAATFIYNAPSIGSQSSTVTYAWSGSTTGNVNGTLTVIGSGVAPVLNMGSSASAGYVLVGSAASAVVSVSNTGKGNTSGVAASISNLRGTLGTASANQFSGGGGSVSLADAASTTGTYTYTPTIRGASTTTVTSSFANGGGVTNASSSVTTTLTGTGVAPVNTVTSTSGTTLVRVGTSSTATVSITNSGDGNKANGGATSAATNLTGNVSAALGTGFTAAGGNPSSVSLGDGASASLGYTYTATARGNPATSTTATVSFSNGKSDGTNAGQTVTASVSAQGVGPQFQSTLSSTVNTPTAVASGATAASGPTIGFGTVTQFQSASVSLTLANITSDSNGGNSALTDLTITKFTLSDPSHFSVGLTGPITISKSGSVLLPITVVSNSTGALSSTLTLFTDQSVALGGIGDTFTYNLTALYVAAPEPATMAVLGVGLAGLAFARKRRARQG